MLYSLKQAIQIQRLMSMQETTLLAGMP